MFRAFFATFDLWVVISSWELAAYDADSTTSDSTKNQQINWLIAHLCGSQATTPHAYK
jgi:hypothetical protein